MPGNARIARAHDRGMVAESSSPVSEGQRVQLDYALNVEVTYAGVEWQTLEFDFVQVEDLA